MSRAIAASAGAAHAAVAHAEGAIAVHGGPRDKSDCHFRKAATEHDKRPGIIFIKWSSSTAKWQPDMTLGGPACGEHLARPGVCDDGVVRAEPKRNRSSQPGGFKRVRRQALRIRRINGMEVRKKVRRKRSRGFK